MKDVGKWIKNVLFGLDQLLNAVGCVIKLMRLKKMKERMRSNEKEI